MLAALPRPSEEPLASIDNFSPTEQMSPECLATFYQAPQIFQGSRQYISMVKYFANLICDSNPFFPYLDLLPNEFPLTHRSVRFWCLLEIIIVSCNNHAFSKKSCALFAAIPSLYLTKALVST